MFNKPYNGTFYTLDDSLNAVPVFRFEPTASQDDFKSAIQNNEAGSRRLDELTSDKYVSCGIRKVLTKSLPFLWT